MKDAGDDSIFVHAPFFENFLDGERMNDVSGQFNGLLDTG